MRSYDTRLAYKVQIRPKGTTLNCKVTASILYSQSPNVLSRQFGEVLLTQQLQIHNYLYDNYR